MAATRLEIRHRITLAIGQLAMAYQEFDHNGVGREQRWKRGMEKAMHGLDHAGDAIDLAKELIAIEAGARKALRTDVLSSLR